MRCPECGGRSRVYSTRPSDQVKQRYRECRLCGHRFVSWEETDDRSVRSYTRRAPAQGDLFAVPARQQGEKR